MKTSAKGLAALEQEEGAPLKAYRDPVGVWTIYIGLTKASGVINPKPGMVITLEEGRRLATKALDENYEPAVNMAIAGAKQHEFDGGILFHWNTGAIMRANWVEAWRRRDWKGVLTGLRAWTKGGGKVLPGLVKRREREYRMMHHGEYGLPLDQPYDGPLAMFVVPMEHHEREEVRRALLALGYPAGDRAGTVTRAACLAFQRDHDLKPDAKFGRATLAMLQRRIDAAAKARQGTGGGVVGGGATGAGSTDLPLPDWLGPAILAAVALYGLYQAYRYRDVIAAKIQDIAPRLAARLRSF